MKERKTLARYVLLPAALMLCLIDATAAFVMLQNEVNLDRQWGKGGYEIVSNLEKVEDQPNYYSSVRQTIEEARQHALETARNISDEGIVLLKNDGILPLPRDATITPLGLRFFEPYYFGLGSSAVGNDDMITPEFGIGDCFELNAQAIALQKNNLNKCMMTHPLDEHAPEEATLLEFPVALFDANMDVCTESVALVMLGRQTGERFDAWLGSYEDGTPHMLALTADERAILTWSKNNCAGVIVVLASSSAMQIPELADDTGIDAILWIGGAGGTGYASLGAILTGDVNPSGRLPVSFAKNFASDACFVNMDDGSDRFVYEGMSAPSLTSTEYFPDAPVAFHEYEEGIYTGYRYWETHRQLEDDDGNTVYPFGYGLSYTSFEQKLLDVHASRNEIQVKLYVCNVGQRAGKTAIQLYVSLPYTDKDRELGVEKPVVQLAAFDKTRLLVPGEKQTLSLSVRLSDIASWGKWGDGGTGYRLEAGAYRFSLRENARDAIDEAILSLNEVSFPSMNSPERFAHMDAYASGEGSDMVCLSRAAWMRTQPTAPQSRQPGKILTGQIWEHDTHNEVKATTVYSLVDNIGENIMFSDLRGRDADDPLWDSLLERTDEIDTATLKGALFEAGFGTGAIRALEKPRSTDYDGPQGLTIADVNGNNYLKDKCAYPASPVQAATWNRQLLYDFGSSVAAEAMAAEIQGWYAPALNVLRSPFCGRASEYFSEDPLLNGYLGAAIISGAESGGLVCYLKHFGPSETENHKSSSTCHWMSEQTLRELYLRSFQIALENASKELNYVDAHGTMRSRTMAAGSVVMLSDAGIGADWTACSPALLKGVLREEWGFDGAIITDMHQAASSAIIDSLLRAGCDMFMTSQRSDDIDTTLYGTAEGRMLLRDALRHLCYAQVNSALTEGMSPSSSVRYHLSPWKLGLAISAIFCLLLLLIALTLAIKEAVSERQGKKYD